MAPDSVIEVRDLSFSYGAAPVLEGVNLQVEAGEFLGIVGPNAGGKSTLLKLILGLLEPQSGQISVLGERPREATRRLGYVPQYPGFPRDFPITVEQTVLLGRVGRRAPAGRWSTWLPVRIGKSDRRLVRQVLEEVEVAELARRQIGSLSGGQLQRVLLARALAAEPAIMILDEPTANIDLRLESDIFNLLERLNARMTILVVSHDVGFISGYVARVACLNRTLVCHRTDEVDGQVIRALYGEQRSMAKSSGPSYGEQVRMVVHRH
ncbi:MAG: ABC transporter ATP-binding protein [Candidatus Thiosymbion ectosymbiont of Robbea hypermnestra]|nr:ABC transporter ATP-binding protein [Candidatus Thiosymbion ectosymbiont of Robbea hypermnestra]